MSTPISRTSGSLSTNGTIVSGPGMLTFASHETAAQNTMYLYDGSTSGNLLLTIPSSQPVNLNTPVQYTNGLYVTLSTGSGIVHYS